jgi:hypothetical protein
MAPRVCVEAVRAQSGALTTPNAPYNLRFQTLAAGAFRHTDHRFEWARRVPGVG